jgi:predicted TIM-barrel fold metal-dependent hydrolase
MTDSHQDSSLTIDTHHHILPDFFWRETENVHAPVGGLAPLRWSKEATISFMDDAGIDVAVVSLSTPGVHTGDSAKAHALARHCNEFSADLVHGRPDRFGGFACLPLPDVDASLEELSYTLDVLELDGFVLFTNSNGVYLGDPSLEPVFEELEHRKTIVYVHPNPSPDATAHSLGLPDNLLDFPTDTNRAVAQMHYTNRFARTPNVKYIFSHAGGSIPYLAARFAIIDEMGFIGAASSEALLLTCSGAFIGIPHLQQVTRCFECCATWRESSRFYTERIFRICVETWQ